MSIHRGWASLKALRSDPGECPRRIEVAGVVVVVGVGDVGDLDLAAADEGA